MKIRAVMILLALTACTVPVSAQIPNGGIVTTKATVKPASIAPGGKGVLTVTMTVAPNFHVNANKPKGAYTIPTVFAGPKVAGVTFGTAHYPAPKTLTFSYDPQPLLVYTGKSAITIPFTVAKNAKSGPVALNGLLKYQGCNQTSCFPPASVPVKASVTIK